MKKAFATSTIRLNTDGLSGAFPDEDIRTISALFHNSARKAQRLIHTGPVNGTITPETRPGWVQPEFGLISWVNGRDMHISLDPACSRWRDTEGRMLFSSTICHELHHCARNNGSPNATLADALVDEGLAMNFELETGHDAPYLHPDAAYVRTLRQNAAPLLNANLNGTKSRGYGRDTENLFSFGDVYSLGQMLIADFLKDKKLTAASAVAVETKDVTDWWEKKGFALSCDSSPLYVRPPRPLSV